MRLLLLGVLMLLGCTPSPSRPLVEGMGASAPVGASLLLRGGGSEADTLDEWTVFLPVELDLTMREIIEFRIPEPRANLLPGNPGRSLGTVRNVRLPIEDERVRLIGELNREFNRMGRSFSLGWSISRHYTPEEMQSARLFALRPRSIFEPCGEMCGTEYDESEACSLCGAGARQSTDLQLPG